jgi:hypothetical protein
VFDRGTNEQIQSAYNLVMALASRPLSRERSKKKRGRSSGSGTKTSGACSRPPLFDSSEFRTAVTSKSSTRSVATVSSSCSPTSGRSNDVVTNKPISVVEARPQSDQFSSDGVLAPESFAPPTPVKEYSLFDNVFSRTVEQVLGRRESPPPALPSRSPAHQTTTLSSFDCATKSRSNVVVDQALLAKAPGYRSGATVALGNPFAGMPEISFPVPPAAAAAAAAGFQWERRTRKYSDSSSSGRSSEDSGVGSIGNSGFTAPAGMAVGLTRFDRQFVGAGSPSPPVGHCWSPQQEPYDDISKPGENFASVSYRASNAAAVGAFSGREEHYSIPDEPMTLPRIASDLNPNAPDFVYYPQHLGVGSQSRSCHLTNGLFIPPAQSSFGTPFDGLTIASPTAPAVDSRAVGSERRRTSGRVAWKKFDRDELLPLPAVNNSSSFDVSSLEPSHSMDRLSASGLRY